MTTITIDRAVVEEALDFIVATNKSSQFWLVPESNLNKTVTALRAALAQQAEPLNLRDPAVRKRLATQWGYVPAAQAEPVEPVAGVVLNEEGRAALVEYGREEWHCVVRNARRLYTAPPKDEPKPMHPELRKMWEDHFDKCFRAMPVPKQAEPVEPVAWVNQANLASARLTRDRGGQGDTHTWSETRSNYHGVPLYTAPPQSKPLTEEEIDGLVIQHAGYGRDNFYAVVRAAIKAAEEGK